MATVRRSRKVRDEIIYHIGYLGTGSGTRTRPPRFQKALEKGLNDHGLTKFEVKPKFAKGNLDPKGLKDLAKALIDDGADLIVAADTRAIAPIRQAAYDMNKLEFPIVMAISWNPVIAGTAANWTTPGGHTTGMSTYADDTIGKQVQYLAAVVSVKKLGILYSPYHHPKAYKAMQAMLSMAVDAAESRGMGPVPISVDSEKSGDVTNALDDVKKRACDAVLVLPSAPLNLNQAWIAKEISKTLPLMGPDRSWAENGALMSYGPDRAALFQSAAAYVVKILRDEAVAGELKIERANKDTFKLCINLGTAKALKLTIPQILMDEAQGCTFQSRASRSASRSRRR